MRKRFAIAVMAVAAYVLVGSVLHYLVFPEPFPDPLTFLAAGSLW